ncbi:hypothetical protein [Edaphobacter albus]|uniref:hypothetical protein n=1 Tax=Edaphobacter sp. 4G125 TaxID=2763071 RepID=UPI001647C78B|nr:hypothetical protein [Edaphobacter sp. 4G125]QNI35818.1 hypothetical protein H7846_12350 [Edaphobacter sp. 4G125]
MGTCRMNVKLSALLCCFAFSLHANAQSSSSTIPLPESPGTITQSGSSSSTGSPSSDSQAGQQTKRILGIIPNFRAVSADTQLPPQSVKDKFVTASEDSFDYSAIIFVGILAGVQMGLNQTPEFHQGAAGYGRYYWHSFADQTVENYAVEFIVPTITRQDTRYYTLGRGGFWKRTGYSLSRAVVTRTDSGGETFNSSEVVGAGIAAGISNLYYPRSQRGFNNTASRWGTNVGIDAGTFFFKEFWPDINRAVFHAK